MVYYLLSFSSTHSAMKAQAILKGRVPATVMPTLREITKSCGVSLRILPEHYALAVETLAKQGFDCGMVHAFEITQLEGGKKVRQIT